MRWSGPCAPTPDPGANMLLGGDRNSLRRARSPVAPHSTSTCGRIGVIARTHAMRVRRALIARLDVRCACRDWASGRRVHRRYRRATLRAQVPRHPDAHHRAVGRARRRRPRRCGHRSCGRRRARLRRRRRRGIVVPPRDHRRVLRLAGELRRARRSRRCVGRRHGVAGRGGDRAGHLRGGGVRDRRATPSAVARDAGPELAGRVRRVEHGVGFTAGGIRRALRQRGAELRLRDVRAALPRAVRVGRARTRQDRRPTSA